MSYLKSLLTNNVTLLVLSLLISLTYGMLRNFFCKKPVVNDADNYLFNTISSVFSTLTLILSAIITGGGTLSLYTLLMGILFGAITAAAAFLNMNALRIGPMSYTTLIVTSSMIIPSLSGVVMFGEKISVAQVIGIVLMLVSLYMAIDRKSSDSKASRTWLLLSVLCLLCTGLIGIIQKLHQNSPHKDELTLLLIVAFSFATVFSILTTWLSTRRNPAVFAHIKKVFTPGIVVTAAFSGIFIALANVINLYLSGAMDSIIFFPIVNGGGLLLAIVAAVVIFRERLSKTQWLGIGVGMAAVVLICNLF